MGLKEQISAAFCVRPRITAVVLLLFGILESIIIWQNYHSSGTISIGNAYIFAPLGLLFGLAGLIERRFIYGLCPNRKYPVSLGWKIATYCLLAPAICVAIYIQTVIFKDWHSVSEVPHIESRSR